MMAQYAALVAGFFATGSALAQSMNAEAAWRFVTGKMFAFRCVDGSVGSGRIYADGSVIGKMRSNSSEPERPVWLPPLPIAISLALRALRVLGDVRIELANRLFRDATNATFFRATAGRTASGAEYERRSHPFDRLILGPQCLRYRA